MSRTTAPASKALMLSLTFAALCAASTGCSNSLGMRYPVIPASAYGSSSSASSSALTTPATGYQCPGSPDVLPSNDVRLDGTDHYYACPDATTASNIELQPQNPSNRQVCAFPVEVLNSQYAYAVLDVSTGQPMVQCAQPVGSGSAMVYTFSFTTQSFNALAVVDSTSESQMQNCLSIGNPDFCPSTYSYGRFR